MTKSSSKKWNGFFKGAILAIALLMCFSFMPYNAFAALAATIVDVNDMHTIILSTSPTNKVTKGDKYTIGIAKYKHKHSDGSMYQAIIGDPDVTSESDTDVFDSKVTVTYKNTKDTETIDTSAYNANTGVYGTFTPSRVGTYVVSYSVKDVSQTVYTYDYEVECQISDAYFKFNEKDAAIIPSIYDLGMLEAAGNGYTDLILPLPTVYDENDEKVMNGEKDLVYVTDPNDATQEGNKNFVLMSVSGGTTAGISISVDDNGVYYIDGDTLKNTTGVGNYTISYAYYDNEQFVVSTEKTFEVSNKYYTNKDKKSGYTLNASWSTTPPDSAVTGVKTELPGVKGVTSASDDPASKSVPVTYSIKIFHKEDGNYVDRTSENLVEEDGKSYFKPFKDGDYKISYEVVDFYKAISGHTAKTETTSFFISGVKDTQLPTVYVYDGNSDYSFDADGNYISAKNKMKSSTLNKNIVVYAIGATDNAATLADMKLTRTIKDAGSTVRIETSDYTTYNLIFNFSSYQDLVSNNYVLMKEMEKDGVNTSTDAEVAQWLKAHNYLVVTANYLKNPIDKSDISFDSGIVTDPDDNNFDINIIKNALVEQGFAYINYDTTNTFSSTQTYRVVYEARDAYAEEKSDKAQLILDMSIKTDSAYTDEAAPVISGPKDLQNAYLPDDKITFTEPSASDTTDNSMEVVKVYRYLDAGRNAIKRNVADETIVLDVNGNSTVAGKWYGKVGTISSDGWYQFKKSKDGEIDYTIDLSEKPVGTAYVELFIYAMDDYGNLGFWNKVMTVAQSNDTDTPELYKVVTTDNGTIKQGQTVVLPKLYFSDDHVDYMTANVKVYHINDAGDKRLMSSSDMAPYSDSYRGTFTLDAGSFVASYAGKYQVVVVAKDAGNHSVATFFEYIAGESTIVEDPAIDNITSETIKLEVGKEQYLPSPTIAISSTSDYQYIGLNTDDDANTATYYTVTVPSAETANYHLDKYYFSANSKGKYTLQYNVYLIQYKTSALTGSASVNGLYLNNENQLMLHDNNQDYYIYVDMDAQTPTLVANTSILGTGTAYTNLDNITDVKLYTMQSEVQTIEVNDTVAPVINVDLSHIQPSYPEKGTTITIPRISATDVSAEGIDPTTSNVSITISKASGTTTVVTIEMDKWEESSYYNSATGNIELELKTDGTYTIKYTVYDYSKNFSELSKTIANGDVVKPVITVDDGFLNKKVDEYALNDHLTLNMSKISFSDDKTDADYLKKTIEVKLVNVDTDTEIKNDGEVNPEQGIYTFDFNLKTAGEYKLTITVRDEAGWTTEKTMQVKVAASQNNTVVTYQVIGTILIVVSVLILVGVIVYFVVSKVKSDKETKKRK